MKKRERRQQAAKLQRQKRAYAQSVDRKQAKLQVLLVACVRAAFGGAIELSAEQLAAGAFGEVGVQVRDDGGVTLRYLNQGKETG